MYYFVGPHDRAILLSHLPQPIDIPPLLVSSDIELRFAYPFDPEAVQKEQADEFSETGPTDSFVEVVRVDYGSAPGDVREKYVVWDTAIGAGSHIWRRYDRHHDLGAHPLAGRGLSSCGMYEVKPSAWLEHIRSTEPENLPGDSVTGYVSPISPTLTHLTYHHMLFAFRDVTLEFITSRLSYELFQTADQVREEMQRIKWGADAYGVAY